MPGTAKQGMSAAIVIQAIYLIEKMIKDAEDLLEKKIDPAINDVIQGVSKTPQSVRVHYGDALAAVAKQIGDVDITSKTPDFGVLPPFIEDAVGTFYQNYTETMEGLFPGLTKAGEDADAWARAALDSAVGVTYIEQVDYVPADQAFDLARKQAWAQERELLDNAATAGYRFAPGVTLNSIARVHAESLRSVTDAQVATYAARLSEERAAKMRLAKVQVMQRMDRIKRVQQQVSEAFKDKLRARGLWMDDQNAVVDAYNQSYVLKKQFQARLAQILQEVTRRLNTSAAQAGADFDLDVATAKVRLANSGEIVDMLGNMISTLNNQIRGNGSYSGSERDVTDWETLF